MNSNRSMSEKVILETEGGAEGIWIRLTSDPCIGVLDNVPFFTEEYELGDLVFLSAVDEESPYKRTILGKIKSEIRVQSAD